MLIAVWDQRSQDHSASDEYGRFIVPRGTDDAHVIKGATLAALSKAIGERLARYENVTGGLKLAPEFEKTLGASIERFNGFASGGQDFDFRRGERQVELLFNGSVASSPSAPNPTMFPISEQGPYYAALLTGGNLDTKGGPKTNVSGQVVDDQDQAHQGALRRRQLRRLGFRPRLLGRWRHDRTDFSLRLFGGCSSQQRAQEKSPSRHRHTAANVSRSEIDGLIQTNNDGRAAKVGGDRISQGVRQGRKNVGRRQHP